MKKSIATGTMLIALLVFGTGCGQKKANENSERVKNALNYQLVKHTKWDANIKQARMFPLDSPDNRQPITLSDGRDCFESDDGSFVLVKTMLKQVTKEENGLRRIELVDSVGNSYWSKDDEVRYEGGGFRDCLANDGTLVRIQQTSGLLTFLDRDGNRINQVDIFDEDIWSRRRIVLGRFSADSRYFAVNACDNVGNTFPNQSGVICFDSRGREIWRYYTDETISGPVWVSSTTHYVIAYSSTFPSGNSFRESTYLLDSDSNLIKKFEQNTGDVLFTFKNDYALLDASRGLQLVDLKTGEIIFDSYSVGSLNNQRNRREILSADVSASKKLFCILKPQVLLVFHFDCTRAWSQAIDRAEATGKSVNPSIQFLQDAEEMVVSLNSGMYKYRLTE